MNARRTAEIDAGRAGTVRIGDLEVVRMAYGAMRLTGEGIWGPPEDREEALRVLRTAVHDLGVTLIDTADAYGPDVNEDLIREALHPYPDHLVIATKGGSIRPGPGEWERNGRPEHLREALEGSLRRLKLERIDLYQHHAPDPEVPIEDSVGELSRLQEEGKIRHVGVSNYDVEKLERAREIVDVVSVQNRYNAGSRESDPVVDWCDENGVAFLPWQPVGGGSVDAEGVQRVADRHDATPAQIALAWLLHRSQRIVPIPGTSSVEHLRENVAAAGVELSDEDIEEIG